MLHYIVAITTAQKLAFCFISAYFIYTFVFEQVAWLGTPKIKVSWERASTLKESVIKEFEDGDNIKQLMLFVVVMERKHIQQ